MSVTTQTIPPRSTISFFEVAAWISLFIATLLVVTIGAQEFIGLPEGDALLFVEEFWFFGLATGFILGVVSLLGFRRHRRKLTLWIALVGVLVGGGLAAVEVAFFIYLLMNFGHQ